jgi:hypothetical protein
LRKLKSAMDEQLVQFQIPIHPEDLLSDNATYSIENPLSPESLTDKAAKRILDGKLSLHTFHEPSLELGTRLGKSNPQDIVEHENFDPLFCFLR